MEPHTLTVKPPGFHLLPDKKPRRHISIPVSCRRITECAADSRPVKRRDMLITPLVAIGAYALRSAVAKADETPSPQTPSAAEVTAAVSPAAAAKEEVINYRIYDATAIGEPLALGKEKRKAWEKMMDARIVYLGEAELVPTRDDKDAELEIVKNLRKRCVEVERPMSLALEAIPSDLQDRLNLYMDWRISAEELKSLLTNLPLQRWQEYQTLLTYCRNNGVRLIACGLPLQVLRTIQGEGVSGLSKADRKKYAPPAGSGFISGFPSLSRRSTSSSPIDIINFTSPPAPYEPSSYLSIQARVVEDYAMSQTILQAVADGGTNGMLVVITGANHVAYGSRGTGLPARISRKMQKKNQVVILLDPERQYIRREGEAPVADFLWYSAARPCSRNCFDRAEIARVMNAAGRRRDALPQDLQNGLDLGLVSPEVLQNFFDLERYPIISELTGRFQGFRERLLADPKFLNRLAIEESISITTALIAQYVRRKEKFIEELDYVITDTLRGIVVDFFTVWLPAPTLSFLPAADNMNTTDSLEAVKGLLGSIPDNAFQKNVVGREWNLNHRIASVVFGGLKLAGVGFISSIGTVASSNILFAVRKLLNPSFGGTGGNKPSPILKSAVVYSTFLGTSANLRYQVIAGIVEHRISEEFLDQPLLVNAISFVARTINSYFGTQQWIDVARYTGVQASESEEISFELVQAAAPAATDASSSAAAIECSTILEVEDTNDVIDEGNNTNNQ